MENTFNNILYPFLFNPNLHEIVWGGEKLTAWKGLPAKDHIGESWEVSCVESSPSIIANGMWAGYTLKDVQEYMGHADIRMTADLYGHLDVARKDSLARNLADSIFQ